MEIQVEKDHYELKNYVNTERWHSYYNQLCEIIAVTQNRGGVFIIGKGDGIVGEILNSVYHFRVIHFDFDASLEPDIVGDVCKDSDFPDSKFDTVVCCQVLEHIPYEAFESAIQNISRICGNTFILSLPVRSFRFSLSFKLPKLRRKVINVIIPRFYEKNVPWKGQHFWEVGTRKKGIRDINVILEKYFVIEKDYYCTENPYHYFWILKCRGKCER